MTINYLRKSLIRYMKIFFVKQRKWIHNTRGCLRLRQGEERKGVKIVWFGVSERETTLHGDLLLMVDKCI